jgi:hypothetical protein
MMNSIRFGAHVTLDDRNALKKKIGLKKLSDVQDKTEALNTALKDIPADVTVGTVSVPRWIYGTKSVLGATIMVNGEINSIRKKHFESWNHLFERIRTTTQLLVKTQQDIGQQEQ